MDTPIEKLKRCEDALLSARVKRLVFAQALVDHYANSLLEDVESAMEFDDIFWEFLETTQDRVRSLAAEYRNLKAENISLEV